MKPDFGIFNEFDRDGFRIVWIDTKKATYRGQKYKELSDYSKRKFENWLVINRPKERLKLVYH